MGGQIMPPVMGAVAFIMAETIGVPYSEIVKAAIIPAILYFASAFWMVHLEAGKRGLHGHAARANCRARSRRSREQWYLVLPLAVLVYLLFAGYTPLFAGSVGLALTVIADPGQRHRAGARARRRCASPSGSGSALLRGHLPRAAASLRRGRAGRALLVDRRTLFSCAAAARRWPVPRRAGGRRAPGAAGRPRLRDRRHRHRHHDADRVGTIFGNCIVSFGKDVAVPRRCVLTMIVSLILGMGIPTIPNYIITVVARRAGPAASSACRSSSAICSSSISASWRT